MTKKALRYLGWGLLALFILMQLLVAVTSPFPRTLWHLALGVAGAYWLARMVKKSRAEPPEAAE